MDKVAAETTVTVTETPVEGNVNDSVVVPKAPSNLRIFLIALFVAFGGFLFGYDCIIGGELLDVDKFRLDFGTPQEPSGELGWSDSLRGAFVSILSAGTFCGALSASIFADKFGRKWGILVTCVIFGVGIAIQTWAPNIQALMLGRCVAGYGVGLVSVLIPLYQGECVPARRRGTMVSCYQLAITVGLLVGQIVVYLTKNMTTAEAYRIPIGLQFAWSGILFCGMCYFPDTPRNLIRKGKDMDALKAKCQLTGLPPTHPEVLEELLEIKGNLQHEMSLGPATYTECFRGLNLKRTLLGIFMQVWQQRISPFTS
jgi:MFS transporter, SP family, sugar:H+ symporter